MASCESTGRELSFEWSHHRILSRDSKVRVTLQNPLKHSGSERVKKCRRIFPNLFMSIDKKKCLKKVYLKVSVNFLC